MSVKDAVCEAVAAISVATTSRVYVAYSGGLDSTALLHACLEVHGRQRCRAIHVDHGINPSSEDWSNRCAEVCLSLGIELEIVRVSLDEGNVEMQARLQRYDQFRRRLTLGDVVATAHHSDDVVESLLWQLLTGRARVGIASSKPLGDGQVVRPFLDLSKQQLADYVASYGLPWISDPSNNDTGLDRNWIRHVLLPLVERKFPGAGKRIRELERPRLPDSTKVPLEVGSMGVSTDEVRAWLLMYGVTPTTATVNEIVRQSSARRDSQPNIRVSSSKTVRRYRERLYVVSETKPFAPRQVRPGEDVQFSNGILTWRKKDRGFASTRVLLASNRQHASGVSMSIQVDSMTKKLSSLFQEEGVAPWLRDGWPMLFEEDHIVCVPGVADADRALEARGEQDVFVPSWQPLQD